MLNTFCLYSSQNNAQHLLSVLQPNAQHLLSVLQPNAQHLLSVLQPNAQHIMSVLQHYLTAVGAIISVPILLSTHFCMDRDRVGLAELIGTIFFVSGMATLLQTTFGVR